MHELSTCKSIILQIQNTIADYKECEITSITMLIGELARVDIDELIELFPLASKGSVAENAELIVKREPAKYACGECNQITIAKGLDLNCAFCQSNQLSLISGTELILDNIELKQV